MSSTELSVPHGTDSLRTHRWMEMDSNFQYAGAVNLFVAPFQMGLRRLGTESSHDSSLERMGFEPLVPLRDPGSDCHMFLLCRS